MVKGIREKFRSNALKDLARERVTKGKPRKVESDDDCSEDDEEQARAKERNKVKASNNSLLAILPKPQNASAFGPTVKIGKLLKMPERQQQSMVVGEVSHPFTEEVSCPFIGDQARPTVVIPKGKEKLKNQITYLAQLGKATELEHKEQAALGRIKKAATRSKYGW